MTKRENRQALWGVFIVFFCLPLALSVIGQMPFAQEMRRQTEALADEYEALYDPVD